MKSWWLIFFYIFFPFCSWSEVPSENELNKIEQEIQQLKNRLHDEQLKEIKEEVKGQEFVIADWDAYAKELQLIHQQEEVNKQIRLRIKSLEERRASLLQESSKFK